MRILLVYPEMPDTFYAMKHFMQVVNKKAAYPPLGLLTVAALLPKEWDKIDKKIKSSKLINFYDKILEANPEFCENSDSSDSDSDSSDSDSDSDSDSEIDIDKI